MPELPEVEITRRGIAPHIIDRRITDFIVRNPHLRWRIPTRLASYVKGREVEQVERRAKYLLLAAGSGSIIIHLGMSGSLRILNQNVPPHQHDHVDIVFDGGICLRYRDPRRFGCILWSRHPLHHRLLRHLGPDLDEVRGQKEAVDDYKTKLQEELQARLQRTPRYRIVSTSGPAHALEFEVEVLMDDEVLARGSGKNRKQAEQVAARAAFQILGDS